MCGQRRKFRFIPAGAGNTRLRFGSMGHQPVHPRRRGEHRSRLANSRFENGSSPQARGTPLPGCPRARPQRFIPAGAGNRVTIPQHRFIPAGAGNTDERFIPVHPSRRGEHHPLQPPVASSHGSSPQARGTPGPCACGPADRRFIPAGAGNTDPNSKTAPILSVHPRRRGEHPKLICRALASIGSSPQARDSSTLFRLRVRLI